MDDNKYYLFYRIDDGEWKGMFYRSFLINMSMDKLYGQFVSSSWFNMPLDHVSHVELMVVRLNASVRFALDSICEEIRTRDTFPEFVVAHERFDIHEIKRQLSEKMRISEHHQISHQGQGEQLSATIRGVYKSEKEIQYSLSCPSFVILK